MAKFNQTKDAEVPKKITVECVCGDEVESRYSDVLGRYFFSCSCGDYFIVYTAGGKIIGHEHWDRYFT